MAGARRSNRSASGRQRKDRVLQARIPEQLEAELRDQASRLGLSVSTIVRNTVGGSISSATS
jgi:antitoxin component of RelBE/YafQ-DinJ toxin-antitoxin module